jgi:hypothetical protein
VVRVDQDLEFATDVTAHLLEKVDVRAPVIREAELDGPKARLTRDPNALEPLLRGDELRRRRVPPKVLLPTTEEPPERLARGPGGKIPTGGLDDPRAPTVEIGRFADPVHELAAAWVHTDQMTTYHVGVRKIVPAGEPDGPVVRRHEDDGSDLVVTRAGIPGHAQGRTPERSVAANLDLANTHDGSLWPGRRRRGQSVC